MEEFKKALLGDTGPWQYAAAFVFALLAIIASLLFHSLFQGKYKKATGTPDRFSFLFLMLDNMKRTFLGLILMFFLFRFVGSWVKGGLSMEWAAGAGFALALGMDQVFELIKRRFNILSDLPRKPDGNE